MSDNAPNPPRVAPQRGAHQVQRLLGFNAQKIRRAVILAIGGIKGGIGKSTTAIFLAFCWARLGLAVLVLDADPKSGSSRGWLRKARKSGITLPFTIMTHVAEDLEAFILDEGLHKKFHIIIIDTGGDNDRILKAAYGVADQMLLTTSPSPVDIDALPATASVVAGELKQQRKTPITFLVTACKSDAMIKKAKASLRDYELDVMRAVVRHRLPYQNAFGGIPDSLMDYPRVQHELDHPEPEEPASGTVAEEITA